MIIHRHKTIECVTYVCFLISHKWCSSTYYFLDRRCLILFILVYRPKRCTYEAHIHGLSYIIIIYLLINKKNAKSQKNWKMKERGGVWDREQGDWKIDPAGSQGRMWVEVDRVWVRTCSFNRFVSPQYSAPMGPCAILPFAEWGPVILLLLGLRN